MSDEYWEKRIGLLSRYYHNERLYAVKLRSALELILKECDDHETPPKWVLNGVARLAREALNAKNAPPAEPSGVILDEEGKFVGYGHPHTEYLHLPMRPEDAYADPKKV